MPDIKVLDQQTIDKIAAGEVVERPASIVKELLENAIDAKATAITIEIKEGGISFIRITDNGCGIGREQIELAFLRHSTSKITTIDDLTRVSSLGFRGEALSSIAAIAQVELITKTASSLTGTRYVIEGGVEKSIEEIGAPEGTTFIIRNIFFNTPVRRKFLKTPATEAGYIGDIIEHLAMSHPEVSIRFINNNQNKVHTSGNSKIKDIIYNIYGRDIASNLISIDSSDNILKLSGYIGKPVISRGNRNFENYYINGRYIKSSIVSRAIEDAYKPYMMQHKYPFTAFHISIDQSMLDVNVHPTKMELRFRNPEEIYPVIFENIKKCLEYRELIPAVTPGNEEKEKITPVKKEIAPEPFEVNRIHNQMQRQETVIYNDEVKMSEIKENPPEAKPEQLELFDNRLLSEKARLRHRLIGQIFDTYWLIEYDNSLYIIDQHAAHEKILYERTMKSLKDKKYVSQQINPPIILSLSLKEEEVLNNYLEHFTSMGYEIEPFGGREYAVRAVPANMISISRKELLIEMIDTLSKEAPGIKSDMIAEKIASMSCKAAVKGNNSLSVEEANELIDELLTLDNPYNCPHGRPTIISMSKYELEKKFKRII